LQAGTKDLAGFSINALKKNELFVDNVEDPTFELMIGKLIAS
jgi:hypothetical protein